MDPEKRESILAAAVECFTKYGYKKASIDEIAQAAGVAKGTVYLYCENKEDLFYQAVHVELRDWIATIAKRIDPRKNAVEILQSLAGVSTSEMDKKPLVRDLLSGLMHGQFPHWHDRLEELRKIGVTPIEEILKLGVQQELFREDLDLPEVARLLQDLEMSGYLHYSQEWEFDVERLQRRMRAGVDLVLHGICK